MIRTISNPGVSVSGMAFMNNEIFLLSDSPNMVTVLDYATGATKRTFTPTWTLRSGLAATADQLLGLEGPWLYFLNPVTGTSTWTWLGTSSASDGMGVVGDELFVSDGTNLNVYSLTTFGLVRTLAGLPELEALGGDGGGFADQDWYSISVQTGDSLVLTTSTPGDGPGEFVNLFDPKLELYDPSGVLVASGTALADGRNETINYTALGSGQYRVHITADAGTLGEYLLTTSGATGAPQPFQIAAVTPADGSVFLFAPTQVTVDFNDNVLLSSLQASDLTVNGTPATGLTVVDGDTAIFTIAALGTGTHTIAIAAGAVQDLQQTNLSAFSSTFSVDQTPPRVIASSIQQNDVLSVGDLTYVVTFDEPMLVANLDDFDFFLLGIDNNVTYTPTSDSYDATGRTLTITYANLPEDRYTLTLLSGSGQFEDVVGNDLDGEPLAFPLPPNVSGDGIDGGHFSVSFSTDIGTILYPTPLTATLPLGSLVYGGTVEANIASPGDTDSFTIDLSAGQTISVVVDPTSGLHPTIELRDPSNSLIATTTSSGPGLNAFLQAVSVATPGIYTITVGGAAGSTGTLSLQIVLNAAEEGERHDGSANDDLATAQDINGSFLNLGGGVQHGVVLGTAEGSDFYSFTLGVGETASLVAKSLTSGTVNLSLQDAAGNVLAIGTTGAANFDQGIQNFVAPTAGTYYAVVTGDVGHAVQPGGDPRGSLRTGGQRQRSDGPGHFPHEPGVGILEFERSGPAVWLRRGEPVDQGDGSAHGGHDPQLCLARGGRLRLGLRHGDDAQLAAGGRT